MALVISSRFHIVAASAELVDCREALRVVVNLRGNKIADRLCKGRGDCTCTLPGEALGARLDKGRLYNDTTRAYQVAVTGLLERASAIMDAVQLARMHYRQESIFVTYLGAAEIIGA